MTERKCEACGSAIAQQPGRHRPRKFCTTCRPPKAAPVAGTVTRIHREPAGGADESMVAATRAELRAAGRDATSEGQLALILAGQIESGAHSGSSLASLSTAWIKAKAEALKGAEPDADVIDAIFGAR